MEELGVVLSGGGVKGVGHIGFLQALKEHNIRPKYISGTSAGALVGALYCAGYGTKEMLRFFKKTPLISWYYYSTSKPGLLDSEKYRVHFEKYFPKITFESLETQLFILTTDIEQGCSVIHHQGDLVEPLMASCSIPLVFSPVKINGVLHSDGGIMNNFPVEPLADLGLPGILGSYVCSSMPVEAKGLSSSIKVMFRAFDLSQEALSLHKFDQCDYVIAPKELHKIGFLDSKGVEEAYQIGYEAALSAMDTIIETLSLDPAMRPSKSMQQPVYSTGGLRKDKEDVPEKTNPSSESAKSNSYFGYFDIWPLNWAFGKQDAESDNQVE